MIVLTIYLSTTAFCRHWYATKVTNNLQWRLQPLIIPILFSSSALWQVVTVEQRGPGVKCGCADEEQAVNHRKKSIENCTDECIRPVYMVRCTRAARKENPNPTCTCTCRVMSFLSVAFIAHISPVLVQSVLKHVHCRSLYYMLR